MKFIKGSYKINTEMEINNDNFMEVVTKLEIQDKLDGFGKYTSLNLGLSEKEELIVEYVIDRYTIGECRSVAKTIKREVGSWFNGKCELGFQAEGQRIR